MKENLRDYARIGITHHLLFPDCVHNPELHLATLPRVLNRNDIEVVDLCVPYGKSYRKKAMDLIKESNKTIIYNGHLLPLMSHPLGTLSPTTREQIVILTKDQIDVAYEIGAKYFLIGTGPESDPPRRKEAFKGLEIYLTEICDYMAKKGDMGFLIELFDRDFAKKFLIGPSSEAVEFVERLSQAIPQIAIEVDVAHIPLMGETFEQTFRATAKYLRHVHLGNCIMRDSKSPFYGDMHPPIGIEGGEIDTQQLVEILRILLNISYLNKENRGSMSIEVRPFPGMSEEETIKDNMNRLFSAWERV